MSDKSDVDTTATSSLPRDTSRCHWQEGTAPSRTMTHAPGNGVLCGSLRLPHEIWDIIILDGYPKSPITSWEVPAHGWWTLCSLVCWQWRRIALPYIFRRIWIRPRSRGVQEYAGFFAKNRHIAQLVHHLHINDREVEVEELCCILSSLPKIRSLHMISTQFKRSENSTTSLNQLDLALECLQWKFERKGAPEAVYNCIFDVLFLFSAIDLLSLCSDYGDEPEPSNDQISAVLATTLVGRPQIRTMSLRCGGTMASFLLIFLPKVGSLDKLTELKISIRNPLQVSGPLTDLLCSVGDTLRSLHLHLPVMLSWLEVQRPRVTRRDSLLDEIGKGFSACSRLEAFSVSTAIFSITGDFNIRLQSWFVVDGIVQLIPVDYLRDLCLDVQFIEANPDIVHSLSWRNLQENLRRFPHLNSLTTRFSSYHKSESVSCAPCVEFELREFRNILRSGVSVYSGDCQCNHSDCKKHSEENDISRKRCNTITLDCNDW